jgi:hypothetical protein
MATKSDAWKELERTVARKLGGKRLIRGNNFSESMLDVEHPWLALDAKWRSSLATVTWFKKLCKDNDKIYKGEGKIPALVIKEENMRGELVVLLLDDFVEAVNSPDYKIDVE